MNKHFVKQNILPLVAALIWGTAFVAQSVCTDYVPPFAFNALRSFIAMLFLIPVSLLFDRAAARRGKPAQRVDWKSLALGGALCGVFLAAGSNLQQFALAEVSVGKAGFVTSLYVVLVPVFGWLLFRKKVAPQVWIGVVLAVGGLYLLCVTGEFTLGVNDLFLLLAALGFTGQILSIDRFSVRVDGVKLSCAQFFFAGVISTAFSLIFETVDWAGVWHCVLPLLYVAIFSSGIAYTLQILAQAGSNPTVVTLLLSLESVFSVPSGAIILGDRLTMREYAGCALMFAAVIFAQVGFKRRKKL